MEPRRTQRPERPERPGAFRLCLFIAVLLLVLALLSGVARYMNFQPEEGARGAMRIHWPFWRSFLMSLGHWAALIPSFLVLARLVGRTPLDRAHWRMAARRHALGVLAYVPAQFLLSWGVYVLLNTLIASWADTRDILSQIRMGTHIASLIEMSFQYFGSVSLLYVWNYFQKEREKRRQLAQAQLRMLRMQLNPHFLFNTLNTVTSLMRRDVDTAERVILALTDFLRSTLEEDGGLESPFAKELEVARRYFEIEAIRFPGRLALDVEAEPGLSDVRVPSFILQPLLENAIRHGLAPRASGGRVLIRAGSHGDRFHLLVQDDGLGSRAGRRGAKGLGVGLSNTRQRLEQLYGDRASLEAGPLPEGGYRVALELPVARGSRS